jgi:hypothetical protein
VTEGDGPSQLPVAQVFASVWDGCWVSTTITLTTNASTIAPVTIAVLSEWRPERRPAPRSTPFRPLRPLAWRDLARAELPERRPGVPTAGIGLVGGHGSGASRSNSGGGPPERDPPDRGPADRGTRRCAALPLPRTYGLTRPSSLGRWPGRPGRSGSSIVRRHLRLPAQSLGQMCNARRQTRPGNSPLGKKPNPGQCTDAKPAATVKHTASDVSSAPMTPTNRKWACFILLFGSKQVSSSMPCRT